MSNWIKYTDAPAGSVARLLCIPRSGGTANDYFPWAERFTQVHLCAAQLPGRQERFLEPAVDRISPIVFEIAKVARELTDLPLVLFGDCLGALVAFEVVRELRRAAAKLPAVIVASYPPPDHRRTRPVVHDAPTPQFKRHLAAIGGAPPELLEDDELFELMLPTLRADFAIFENYSYTPEPPLDVALEAIGGRADAFVSEDALGAWSKHTNSRFSVQMFEGDHSFVHKNPAVAEYVERQAVRYASA